MDKEKDKVISKGTMKVASYSYYEYEIKRKENIEELKEEKNIYEVSNKNNMTNKEQAPNVSNQDDQRENEDISEKQDSNEKENEKSLKEKIKDSLKNEKNLTILATIGSIIIFLFQAYKSWDISDKYGIPIDSIKIDTKAPSLFIALISIPILLSIIMSFSKKGYERLDKIMFHTILMFSNFLYYIMIIIYCKKITNIYLALRNFTIVQIIIGVLFVISYFAKKLKIIVKTVNIVIYFLLIIILLCVMFNKSEKFQIITLKNSEKKVVIGYYENEYLAFDYDEKNLKIFKTPVYMISTSDIEEIKIEEFNGIANNLQKEKEIQIITLNNGKQRVVLSEPNGAYNAFDFEQEDEKLIIYKIPSYEIITSEIKNIEPPKEFEKVEYKNFMLAK